MAIVSCLLDVIAPRFFLDVITPRYFLDLPEIIDSLKEAMYDLKCVRDDVKIKLDIAERQLLHSKNDVKWWLEKVEVIEREVYEMEAAYQQMRGFGNCLPNCWSRYQLGKRATEKLIDVNDLKRKGDSFDVVAEKPLPDVVEEQPTTSALGMGMTFEKVRGYLREDSVGVLGIYGMGGVGKTTLLKAINNETRHGFDMVIWLVVSKEVNVGRIQNDVAKRLGLSLLDDTSNWRRAADIHRALSRMKFMLLLDDIWQRLDLEMVGIPRPSTQNQSKVVFTTRSMDVCHYMKADKMVKVELLAWKEAWDLFREKVGGETLNSHPAILGLAERVAEECSGLPLLLITIARAMAGKQRPEEWKYALTALRRSPSEISGMEDEVLFRLKFSYDNLRDDTVKSCFIYCSLFPEDYDISKERLIDYWIGEGFLDDHWDDDVDEARNKGHYVIATLQAACLLESGSDERTEVKMHGATRDLAFWISSEYGKKKNKLLVKAGVGLIEAPVIERWTEAERISLMNNEIKEITEIPKCPNLLTLMLQSNPCNVLPEFFQFMPRLRVLDLSRSSILELPAGIGYLSELRYLNLSVTKIRSLPEEIGNLVKLEHLNLNHAFYLDRIPHGAISRLFKLTVMKLYESYSKWEERRGGFDMTELEGLVRLTHLDLTVSTLRALERLLSSSKLRKVTRYLYLRRCEDLTTSTQLSSAFAAMKSLKGLFIANCRMLEELTIGANGESDGDYLVSSLEWLHLSGLFGLNCIQVGRGSFGSLRTINISTCTSLKKIYGLLKLESLETIQIEFCDELEEVIGMAGAADEVKGLMQLKSIELWCLPELTSICSYALDFPSLEVVYVMNCPKLKQLPLSLHSTNSLREIRGEKEWWDGLEWEDASIRSCFLPFFKQVAKDVNDGEDDAGDDKEDDCDDDDGGF